MTEIASRAFVSALIKKFYPEKHKELEEKGIKFNLSEKQMGEVMKTAKALTKNKKVKAEPKEAKKKESPVIAIPRIAVSGKGSSEKQTLGSLKREAGALGIKYKHVMSFEDVVLAILSKKNGDHKTVAALEEKAKKLRNSYYSK